MEEGSATYGVDNVRVLVDNSRIRVRYSYEFQKLHVRTVRVPYTRYGTRTCSGPRGLRQCCATPSTLVVSTEYVNVRHGTVRFPSSLTRTRT